MLLRIGRDAGAPGIEMVTIDARPGLRDTSIALRDGLGHGPLAASTAMEAVTAILTEPAAEPAALVERAHRSISHTRGRPRPR
jgi:hypothetical protein